MLAIYGLPFTIFLETIINRYEKYNSEPFGSPYKKCVNEKRT
jgi:hypothetical protein